MKARLAAAPSQTAEKLWSWVEQRFQRCNKCPVFSGGFVRCGTETEFFRSLFYPFLVLFDY